MGRIYKYKNVVLDMIQRNNRKIAAIIRQNQIHRIKIYILLLAICISVFNPLLAIENNDIYYGDYTIHCYIDPNMYVKYGGRPQPNYEYYYIKEGIEYPVYCMNLGMKGAEDSPEGYLVNGNSKIEDNILQRIVLNCYPYKSIEELGVQSKSQAKFASQFAIWIYLENLNINIIEPIGQENTNVVNAIKNIYYSGVNNNANSDIMLDYTQSEQYVEIIDNVKCYVKELDLKNINNIREYKLNIKDNNIKFSQEGNIYKIWIPVNLVNDTYNVDLNIDIVAKENVSLLGKSYLPDFQDVVLTLKDYFSTTLNKSIQFINTESEIIISKKDKDTNEPIEGVKYLIKDESNNILAEHTTDKNGVIKFNIYNNNSTKIHINEIDTLNEYRLDKKVYEITLDRSSKIELELFNEKKKGEIKIVKKTKEYNEITNIKENMPLSNVSFYIYDKDMNLVDDITTDEYGLSKSKKLPLGTYYIKEYKTNSNYKLLDNIIEVEIVEDNETVNVEILNENIDIPRKLPETGR